MIEANSEKFNRPYYASHPWKKKTGQELIKTDSVQSSSNYLQKIICLKNLITAR